MGVGIHMLADIGSRGLFRRGRPARAAARAAEQLRAAAAETFPQLGPYTRVRPGDDGEILVRLHPAEEEVRVSVHGDRVLLSARTNGAGPGYHAFVVRLMDGLAADSELRWLPQVTEGEDTYEDETGYFAHRRFADLQTAMTDWLQAVARGIADGDTGEGPWLISMPLGTPLAVDLGADAVCPTGRYAVTWLAETAEASGSDLAARAASFFPWWGEAADQRAATGAGRTALWRFAWRPPRAEDERALADVALACLGQGLPSVGPGGTLGRRDVEELAVLVASEPEAARRPSADGFGFMRGPVRLSPFPGCALTLPGYFFDDDEDEGRTKVYWHGPREVRVVSWLVSAGADDVEESARDRVDHFVDKQPGRDRSHDFAFGEAPVDGHCAFAAPEPGDHGRHAHAVVQRPGRMLIVTAAFEAPEDVTWVRAVMESIGLYPTEGD